MSTVKKLLVRISQGIFEYLLFLPVFLMIGVIMIDDLQLWNWLLSLYVLFIVGVSFRTIFPHQKWWLFSLYSIVIGVSTSFIFAASLLLVILLAMIHTLIVYRGMMYASQTWEDLLPISFLWLGGLGVYFMSYFIFRTVEGLNLYLNQMTVFGTILIVMTMFVSNSDHLKNTTLSKEKKPFISRIIKKQNRVFLAITIVIIALIANGQMIREGLWNGFRAVVRWLIEFLSGSESGEVIEEPPPPPPVDPMLPFEDPKEPSAIAKFLEAMTEYVTYFLLAVATILLILLFIKKTRIWITNGLRMLIQFLRTIVNQMTTREESMQYIEEKENVFDWQEWKDEQQSKAKGLMKYIFKRKPSWDSLTNQQKVRYVFRNFLLQEIELTKLKKHDTPREILAALKLSRGVDDRQIEQLRIAYEQTRYGEQDIDEQIINEIYAMIDKK
jgi:hypothetical protein